MTAKKFVLMALVAIVAAQILPGLPETIESDKNVSKRAIAATEIDALTLSQYSNTLALAQRQIEELRESLKDEAVFSSVEEEKANVIEESSGEGVFNVPFYSQFADISRPEWRKIGCGIASLGMIIDFYKPTVSIDTLLDQGIASNAYLRNAGWTHAGLIGIARKYGLDGATHSFPGSKEAAFEKLKGALAVGPVMASVHYTFEPTNPIPHLVVINGVENGLVYYNDPAEKEGGGSVSIEKFKRAWKNRYIEIRPVNS